jgi:tetraacyldisaccharide 4'-kinase
MAEDRTAALTMLDPTRLLRDVVWPRRGTAGRIAWAALLPVSWLFAAATALRNAAYELGLFTTERSGIGVVSVGNLAVGGTGKTPIALWLARQLAADGTKVAVVLRGYRGRSAGVTVVSRGGGPLATVDQAGDEAIMLAKCFEGAVVTARRRIEGVRQAERLGCALVVLDDGFQHRSLARDFDLVVVDGKAGSFLPAGPLREGFAAIERADAVALVTKEGQVEAGSARKLTAGKPLYEVRFAPVSLIESDGGIWHERPLGELSGTKIVVVSGIAEPASFYAVLRDWEVEIVEVFEYPDHHAYTQQDWQTINRRAHEVELIVTTEKDLVKLEHFPFARGKLVALRIAPTIDRGEELVRAVRERALHRSLELGVRS